MMGRIGPGVSMTHSGIGIVSSNLTVSITLPFNRLLIISAEDRNYPVALDNRSKVVEYESRINEIKKESRIVVIDKELRVTIASKEFRVKIISKRNNTILK